MSASQEKDRRKSSDRGSRERTKSFLSFCRKLNGASKPCTFDFLPSLSFFSLLSWANTIIHGFISESFTNQWNLVPAQGFSTGTFAADQSLPDRSSPAQLIQSRICNAAPFWMKESNRKVKAIEVPERFQFERGGEMQH